MDMKVMLSPPKSFLCFHINIVFWFKTIIGFPLQFLHFFIPSQIVEFESNPKIAWKFGEVSDDKNKTFIGIEERIIMLFRPLQF